MKILLTNDDGIKATGINALYNTLSKNHEVYMIAPDKEKSACSNAITLKDELLIEQLENNCYTVAGFPADCVNIGLHSKLIPDVDIVLSGINHGPNMGVDIYYSGTTGGARSAHIFGKNSIAISLNCFEENNYFIDAAKFLNDFLKSLNLNQEKKIFYNINYPAINKKEVKGIKYTFLGKRTYNDQYIITRRFKNHFYMKLNGTMSSEEIADSDIMTVEKGYISITPLILDSTDYTALKTFSNWNEK